MECLNELVTDALELAPDCLTYMSKLQCAEIFRFCAIPQVMPIATLDKCFANPNVFTGVVKIRKGTSCKLLLRTNSLDEVHETFYIFAKSIMTTAKKQKAAGVVDPSYERTMKACEVILEWTEAAYCRQSRARRMPLIVSGGLLAAAAALAMGSPSSASTSSDMKSTLRATLVGTAGLVYAFGFDVLRPSNSLKTASELGEKSV